MTKPRVLFLQHEQRFFYWMEPGYMEIYRPMILSGLLGEIRSYPYQRMIRLFRFIANRGTNDPNKISQFIDQSLATDLDQCLVEFNPDLVVYFNTMVDERININLLTSIRDVYGFKLMSTFWDYNDNDKELIKNDKGIAAISDLAAVIDSSTRVDRIRSRSGDYAGWTNVEAVHFMPTIPDPTLFKPSEIRRFDITVSGSSEGIRGQIYQLLLDAGFNVHRSGGMMQNDHFLSHAEYAQEMAESRIVVNTQTWDYRIQLKGRTAQALACGCFLLEQRTIESERFLADIGVVLWSDIADLVEKARYWLAHDEEREKLAQDCRRRYLERHSCESWTRTVLQRCGLLS